MDEGVGGVSPASQLKVKPWGGGSGRRSSP